MLCKVEPIREERLFFMSNEKTECLGYNCPECEDSFWKLKSLFWHLVCEHGFSREEAFEVAGSVPFIS